MDRLALYAQIQKKKSYLCIGLDTDPLKLPAILKNDPDPVYAFNKAIIQATSDLCVAYKPNLAFYESMGAAGWKSLEKTLLLIPEDIFTIADAKRGDIGNTSTLYARAFFENLNFDSVTVAPYMGRDSVQPFLAFQSKWAIVLALTSNAGAMDFQTAVLQTEEPLFEKVLRTVAAWGTTDNLMFVVGATRAEEFARIRKIVPDHFLLVPGVGAQGGDLKAVSRAGMNDHCGLLVNSSRQIIYASSGSDFAEKAREAALAIQQEMKELLDEQSVLK
jgi:orotidine-5'-phosphate decarboxylase